jgi:hypothetical protein
MPEVCKLTPCKNYSFAINVFFGRTIIWMGIEWPLGSEAHDNASFIFK